MTNIRIVKKAIIPAGGLGKRFLPFTKSLPKEMLPLIDTPALHYLVKEAYDSGITDLAIVINESKRMIQDYFKITHIPENATMDVVAPLQELNAMVTNMNIEFIVQEQPLGLGHAISLCEEFVGGEPFLVILGDDLVLSRVPCSLQLIAEHYRTGGTAVLGVQRVPEELVSKYGIVDCTRHNNASEVLSIVEKPSVESAPSNLAVLGRYILTPDIFNHLGKITPGVGGELQLTDAIGRMIDESRWDEVPVTALEFSGTRYDLGSKSGYIDAVIRIAKEYNYLK